MTTQPSDPRRGIGNSAGNKTPGLWLFTTPLVVLGLLIWGLAAWRGLGNPFASPALAQSAGASERAPDFPADFTWINTPTPLSFKHQLKGQVVLLDFWTYGCINCIHIIPELARLQKHFAGQPFVIIGVHSAKFTNEGLAANVRQAVLRYKIDHPVVVDQNMRIWNDYGVDSWPTLVLVGANRKIIGSVSGEGNYNLLKQSIAHTLATDKANGWLAAHPLVLPKQKSMMFASGLLFPGKVIADHAGKRIFIADTDHNRIVAASWPNARGRSHLLAVYGNGRRGSRNGAAAKAEFSSPQGLALNGQTLYVADTNNHLIRAIDLKTGQVKTVLGTGHEVFDLTGGGIGTNQGINSPWDLAIRGKWLYIAMAGEHQIWRMNLKTQQAAAFAGSGAEGLQNGSLSNAHLAQPSGLALAGDTLYFADSENSAVRGVNLSTKRVFTLVGHGLFDFGDQDGPATSALFQHDLGVAALGNNLLVADTYNDKLRLIHTASHQVTTFAGNGKPGTGTPGGALQLYEPGGLSVWHHIVFVADTDNQRIVRINAQTGQWHEVMISGLHVPVAAKSATVQTPLLAANDLSAELKPDTRISISAAVVLPTDTHLTTGVPVSVRITDGGRTVAQQTISAKGLPLLFRVHVRGFSSHQANGKAQWRVEVFYAYCTNSQNGVCVPAQAAWNVHVTFSSVGKTKLHLVPMNN